MIRRFWKWLNTSPLSDEEHKAMQEWHRRFMELHRRENEQHSLEEYSEK